MHKKSLIGLLVIAATQLTACSSSSDSEPKKEVNLAPTAIQISSNIVAERLIGAEIGTLTATDPNENETFTFSTSSDVFVINGTTLSLAENVQLDFETETSVDVSVTVTDSGNLTYTQTLTIDIDDVPDIYSFTNKLSNSSSVSYSGQTARHVLISELNNYIDSGLKADIDGMQVTTREEVLVKLMSYYKMTADEYDIYGDRPLTLSTSPDREQNTLLEISGSKKDLSGKIAGNDATGQHKDWSTEFVAFTNLDTMSPEALILHFFNKIADNAEIEFAGNTRTDLNGNVISKIYLSEDGLDYKQLIQKTLLGAITFSQGTDDYLDADVADKGLLTDNVLLVDGKTYTNLEHQFDEGFGYFGAARDYLDYSDAEIAKKGGRDNYQGMHDSNNDGSIDLVSEFNFGHSQNAAKRDLGTASNTAPTQFSELAMQAFLNGRALIAANVGADLTEAQMTELLEFRDQAVLNWEKAIAATAVHYINDVTADYATFGTTDFNYADLAKHWSELKGFAISLQFNPHSPLTDEAFIEINTLINNAPVLVEADVAAYLENLASARLKLQQAYEFNAENVENW